jgi:hypothetical protein
VNVRGLKKQNELKNARWRVELAASPEKGKHRNGPAVPPFPTTRRFPRASGHSSIRFVFLMTRIRLSEMRAGAGGAPG